jgi:NAD(P)-dependent dehydrogenase (short-subunit alcohol dehydrogenase family)
MTTGFDDIFSIRGKVALVTGGSRGIGEMIAAGFLAAGAKVYISSRKADVCDATAERLSKTYDGTCISLPADLSQMSGIESLATRLGADPEKIHRVPHPIQTDIFKFDPAIPKKNQIISVGRWESYQKNLPLLLKTLRTFLDKNLLALVRYDHQ